MAVDGLLRGAGDMKMFTIANLVNLSIRVILAVTLAPRFGIAWVWYAVPVGWFANWAISYSHYQMCIRDRHCTAQNAHAWLWASDATPPASRDAGSSTRRGSGSSPF